MTRDELIKLLDKGEKAFRKQDFSGQDLSGLDLSGCDLRRSDFTNTNLKGANLTNATLVVCEFSGADLSGAMIDGVDWELCKNLDLANFIGAIYDGVSIEKQAIVDTLGKYQRLITDRFIQIGCLKGNEIYWKTMTDAKLDAEVEKVNPGEKADARAWKAAHLAKTITDHENAKK